MTSEKTICNRGDAIKAQYLADGGEEKDWSWDFWGMIASSLKVSGKWDEYVRRQQDQ